MKFSKTDATSYGYRTMHQILIKEGYKIGVNKVHKLMKLLEEEKGIKPISKKIDTEKEPIQHSHIFTIWLWLNLLINYDIRGI